MLLVVNLEILPWLLNNLKTFKVNQYINPSFNKQKHVKTDLFHSPTSPNYLDLF